MLHLRSVALRATPMATFPFDVPAIRTLGQLEFTTAVTFFVGENGSGKSTLLEGIAAAAGLVAVGSEEIARDATLESQRALAKQLRLSWSAPRTRRGFFLRAEDFFGFAKRLSAERGAMRQRLEEIDAEYQDRSDHARTLAAGPAHASLDAMQRRYGANLDAASHGQSFLTLLQSRLVPGGLYLLDEPETPLSPQNVLGLMALMLAMEAERCQFIVATHSPILLAYPGSTIYDFDATPIESAAYESLTHVNLTRDFLNAPERYVKKLGVRG